MRICYEYVGFVRWWFDLGGEGQAAWLSAIGGLVAVSLTAWFYFKDSRERLRIERLATAEHQRERAYRARKLALRIVSIIETSSRHYQWISRRLSDPEYNHERVPFEERANWDPIDTTKLEELMKEMSDFSQGTQTKLIFHANMLDSMRFQFDRWAIEHNGALDVTRLRKFVPDIQQTIQSARDASHALQEELARAGQATNE